MEYCMMKNDIDTQPESIAKAKGASILYDFVIQTDRKIKSNRPHIMVKDYKRKLGFLIEMSERTDNNLSVKK